MCSTCSWAIYILAVVSSTHALGISQCSIDGQLLWRKMEEELVPRWRINPAHSSTLLHFTWYSRKWPVFQEKSSRLIVGTAVGAVVGGRTAQCSFHFLKIMATYLWTMVTMVMTMDFMTWHWQPYWISSSSSSPCIRMASVCTRLFSTRVSLQALNINAKYLLKNKWIKYTNIAI